MTFAYIVDPGLGSALHAGRVTALRVPDAARLAACAPGDRVMVREACVPGRLRDGQELATDLARATHVVFPDGMRRDEAGRMWQGALPRDAEERWVAAPHMPDWACRTWLVVEGVHREPLHDASVSAMRAEGLLPVLGGLAWRWPRPVPVQSFGARRAYARYWTIRHPTAGLRWQDNPQTAVLTVRAAQD